MPKASRNAKRLRLRALKRVGDRYDNISLAKEGGGAGQLPRISDEAPVNQDEILQPGGAQHYPMCTARESPATRWGTSRSKRKAVLG